MLFCSLWQQKLSLMFTMDSMHIIVHTPRKIPLLSYCNMKLNVYLKVQI